MKNFLLLAVLALGVFARSSAPAAGVVKVFNQSSSPVVFLLTSASGGYNGSNPFSVQREMMFPQGQSVMPVAEFLQGMADTLYCMDAATYAQYKADSGQGYWRDCYLPNDGASYASLGITLTNDVWIAVANGSADFGEPLMVDVVGSFPESDTSELGGHTSKTNGVEPYVLFTCGILCVYFLFKQL